MDNKESKKKSDKSSIFITVGLVVLFIISQFSGVFESKVIFSAKSQNRPAFELLLRKNGEYELTGIFADYNCHYFGNYKWNNDTLKLDGNGQIDSKYYWDKENNMLLSTSEYFDNLSVEKPVYNAYSK